VLLVLLGVANVVFGVFGLATDLVRLSRGTAGVLLALGLATAVVGVFVWRGSRGALRVALLVFGTLFVLEIVTAAVDGPTGRVVVLAVVVGALVFAWLKGPGNRSR
jgi:hypothetical protein